MTVPSLINWGRGGGMFSDLYVMGSVPATPKTFASASNNAHGQESELDGQYETITRAIMAASRKPWHFK